MRACSDMFSTVVAHCALLSTNAATVLAMVPLPAASMLPHSSICFLSRKSAMNSSSPHAAPQVTNP